MDSPASEQRLNRLLCLNDWAITFKCFWAYLQNFAQLYVLEACPSSWTWLTSIMPWSAKKIIQLRQWLETAAVSVFPRIIFSVTGLSADDLQGILAPVLVRESNNDKNPRPFIVREAILPSWRLLSRHSYPNYAIDHSHHHNYVAQSILFLSWKEINGSRLTEQPEATETFHHWFCIEEQRIGNKL